MHPFGFMWDWSNRSTKEEDSLPDKDWKKLGATNTTARVFKFIFPVIFRVLSASYSFFRIDRQTTLLSLWRITTIVSSPIVEFVIQIVLCFIHQFEHCHHVIESCTIQCDWEESAADICMVPLFQEKDRLATTECFGFDWSNLKFS